MSRPVRAFSIRKTSPVLSSTSRIRADFGPFAFFPVFAVGLAILLLPRTLRAVLEQDILQDEAYVQEAFEVWRLGNIPRDVQPLQVEPRGRRARRTADHHRHIRKTCGRSKRFEDLDAIVFRQAEVDDGEVWQGAAGIVARAPNVSHGLAAVL